MKRLIAAFIGMTLFLGGCGSASATENNTEQTAFIINGEEISLREWNFYIRMNQMIWEKDDLEEAGDDMWSQEVSDDGTTLADNLKEQVLDTIVQIHLMNQHAEEYGAALTDADETEILARAKDFMENYHEKLLEFAGADENFVKEKLAETRLSEKVAEVIAENYEPELKEEDYHREGICYVLISTTGLRDEEGTVTPFSEEEVARRTALAYSLAEESRQTGSLKISAEAEGLTPIESSMGNTNEGDGQEPLMLDAARALEVGEISDPVETEEGWFLVQHTSDNDADGTEYWKEYLTEQEKESYCSEIYQGWKEKASIELHQDVMDTVIVKEVLKELL